jgi:serine/threonine protein kinase
VFSPRSARIYKLGAAAFGKLFWNDPACASLAAGLFMPSGSFALSSRPVRIRRPMSKSLLQRSAVASRLVSEKEIETLVAELRAANGGREVSDERLGDRLVADGKLNTWQVQQLKNGRTKFTLGNYHFVDSLGKGGMGEVYKAQHTIMGRMVAVKLLPRSRSTPEAIANFHREIRTLAQLDHENLVRAYDAGQDGNVHFLVTEYIPGTDLRKLIRGTEPLTMQQAASIISQAALGLEHAHSRGLIHRDIKPANLLVTPDGKVRVLDLGLAGYFNDPEQMDQYGGKVVGTADYLAPEAILRPDQLDKRSDIYSLGCTLYYAVTGKVPFPGGEMRDKAKAHCQLAPLDPRRLNPALSNEFVEVIGDMMAKRPEDRVSSAMDVVERLRPWAKAQLPAPLVAEPVATLPPPIMPRRPVPSVIGDTEPFFVQPAHDAPADGSGSQVSLGTQAAAHGDETIPSFRSRSNVFARRVGGGSGARSRKVLLSAAIMLVVGLSVVAFKMLFTMLTTHPH